MLFTETKLAGAFEIELERHTDSRGFFARTWCAEEFGEHGLRTALAQCSISFNLQRGTLRGMHWQEAPHEEAKLVRCSSGSIYDVIVDLRPTSPTYLGHVGVELDAGRRNMLYVPEGFAHGFLTLEPDTEVVYQMSEFYAPEAARGARYDDPAFGIAWPAPVAVIAERDASYPDFTAPANPGAAGAVGASPWA
jgi:dTDP-4-dehydrorhamnose 3,5-epimerase